MKINLKNFPILLNEVYRPLLAEDYIRYIILYGGSGSGKSYSIGQVLLYKILAGKIRGLLVVRKTKVSLKHSTFALFKSLISEYNMDKLFLINKTDFTITCVLNNAKIIFSGLDDVEKLKSIFGISHIFIEEASECSREDIIVLDTRLRGDDGYAKQMYLAFNPVSTKSFLKIDYFDPIVKKLKIQNLESGVYYKYKNTLVLKTTYIHNKHNGADYETALLGLAEKDEQYYNVYALGNWGGLKGRIFKNVRYITDKEAKEFPRNNVRYGFDFGYSPDPAAFVKFYIDNVNKKIYVENYYYLKEMTAEECGDALLAHTDIKMNVLRCDAANPAGIKSLQKKGIHAIAAPKPPDSIKAGISWLKNYEILIAKKPVPILMDEADNYMWKLDKDGEATNQPGDKHNHLFDAMRYAAYNDIYNNVAKAGPNIMKKMFFK